MSLYIVVHHRNDIQKWANSWLDDERLAAITTTAEIGRLCQIENQQNRNIYVHRCAWNGDEPIICCSIRVKRVEEIDRKTSLVEFTEQKVLNSKPITNPVQGQNYYII